MAYLLLAISIIFTLGPVLGLIFSPPSWHKVKTMLDSSPRALALASLSPAAYAERANAERNALAAAEGWTFWTTAPTDPTFYEGLGLATALDYVRWQLINDIQEVHYDEHLYNYPDARALPSKSLEQLEVILDAI